jgi:hypothetical protein
MKHPCFCRCGSDVATHAKSSPMTVVSDQVGAPSSVHDTERLLDMTALHWRRALRETPGSLAHKGALQ